MKALLQSSIVSLLVSASAAMPALSQVTTSTQPANGSEPETITIGYQHRAEDWMTRADERNYYRYMCSLQRRRVDGAEIMRLATIYYAEMSLEKGVKGTMENVKDIALEKAIPLYAEAMQDRKCN